MSDELPEPDPNLVAAIAYRSEDDIDTILADFGEDLVRAGDRLGGIVQRNSKDDSGKLCDMAVIDLMTGARIGISQTLGSGSGACKLNSAGLAEASRAVTPRDRGRGRPDHRQQILQAGSDRPRAARRDRRGDPERQAGADRGAGLLHARPGRNSPATAAPRCSATAR